MLSEQRLAEQLARATTEVQREKMRELAARGKDVYPEKRQGRSVVKSYRRYLETGDPAKIDQGLYHFSTMGSGGLNDIAHYNLHGFRAEYPHPAHYIQRLLIPEMQRYSGVIHDDDYNGYHSHYVYTDGMTAAEVSMEIMEITAELNDKVTEDYYARRNTQVLAEAEELAARIGMKIVPS